MVIQFVVRVRNKTSTFHEQMDMNEDKVHVLWFIIQGKNISEISFIPFCKKASDLDCYTESITLCIDLYDTYLKL